MTTASTDHFEELSRHYALRDTDSFYRSVTELVERAEFPDIVEQLIGETQGPNQSRDLIDIIRKLTRRIEARIADKRARSATLESYYGIEETLKERIGSEVSEIYIETIYPNDLVEEARRQFQSDGADTTPRVLPVKAVDKYKKELIRVEKGRRALVEALEQHSNFPLEKVGLLMKELGRLHQRVRSSYRYLSLKPAFLEIVSIGESTANDFDAAARSLAEGAYPVLQRYRDTGEEPPLVHQIELRFAVARLIAKIRALDVIAEAQLRELDGRLATIWSYKGAGGLGVYGHGILVDTLRQVNRDKQALSKKLAKTLVDEYREAEKTLSVIHWHIRRQLACTAEFLKHLNVNESELGDADKAKARIAQDKVIGLDGIFDLTEETERARAASPMEIERIALGVPTNVESRQIVEWLRIYGVIFANSDFLGYSQENIDFSTMRRLISHLSTYHLIQNIAFLRHVVERGLTVPEEEKARRFKLFNQALKLKLHGLMGGSRVSLKGISEMIAELGFIDNKQIQFLIADTFKGFEALAIAFEQTTKDYFVNDREALLKEARELYNEVCTQCMKNFVYVKPKAPTHTVQKKPVPWYRRLFS